jgi:hypothetical protein
MVFDIEKAQEDRKKAREEKKKPIIELGVSLVRSDGESFYAGHVNAVDLDDAVTKARIQAGLEEEDIIRKECRAKNIKTGEVLNY